MKVLLQALGNKYFLWALIVIGSLGAFQIRSCQKKENDRLDTYNRQLRGQLSEKERELQAAHYELGVARSELLTQKELTERWKKEREEIDKAFEKFVKDNALVLKSKDKTIADLRQQIHGGNSGTDVTPTDPGASVCDGIETKCVIKYTWEDTMKRFKLSDPNIFELNNELFESNQLFKIYGEIWEQRDGSLQIKRLVLREVTLGQNGEYEDIPGGKANILDSKFEYHNPPSDPSLEFNWKDLFRLRGIAIASVTAFPDSGRTRLGLGLEFFNWKGLGINTHTALDFKDAKKIEQRIGLGYNPTLFGVDLNLALGVSVGTPFARMFNDYSVNADLIFYLNQ